MDKRILELVADFEQWKGDSYRLAILVGELQKQITKEKLIELGYVEAAEVI